ncbi:unnamed protein product [Sphagnum troendelagicum]|uniref:Uncharacterized protein n=1 Tax=Sphagnum troendelagicum TaxID=128251 RepID=A0ABP0TY80_9BRYO
MNRKILSSRVSTSTGTPDSSSKTLLRGFEAGAVDWTDASCRLLAAVPETSDKSCTSDWQLFCRPGPPLRSLKLLHMHYRIICQSQKAWILSAMVVPAGRHPSSAAAWQIGGQPMYLAVDVTRQTIKLVLDLKNSQMYWRVQRLNQDLWSLMRNSNSRILLADSTPR